MKLRIVSGKLHFDASPQVSLPKLSAAMTTPSLNFAATTEVPVTMGLWVCWLGPEAWKCEWS